MWGLCNISSPNQHANTHNINICICFPTAASSYCVSLEWIQSAPPRQPPSHPAACLFACGQHSQRRCAPVKWPIPQLHKCSHTFISLGDICVLDWQYEMGLSKFQTGSLSHLVVLLLRWARIGMMGPPGCEVMNASHHLSLSLSNLPVAALRPSLSSLAFGLCLLHLHSYSSSCPLAPFMCLLRLFASSYLLSVLLFLLSLFLLESSTQPVAPLSSLLNQTGIQTPAELPVGGRETLGKLQESYHGWTQLNVLTERAASEHVCMLLLSVPAALLHLLFCKGRWVCVRAPGLPPKVLGV